jgi:hypothetical protein
MLPPDGSVYYVHTNIALPKLFCTTKKSEFLLVSYCSTKSPTQWFFYYAKEPLHFG